MKKAITISPQAPEHQSADFNYLKEKGVAAAQRLSGDIWTDYNVHDPGITILEMICYAITELGYQTNQPIEQLLLLNYKDEIEVLLKNNAFFEPQDVYPTSPVTINDYRKLIIDKFPEVKNAWIEPAQDRNTKGLYNIKILTDITGETGKKTLTKEIKSYFYQHRNLCEGIKDITFIDAKEVNLHAEVSLQSEAIPEVVFANIILAIEDVFMPPITFYSLNDLREKGIPLDEILNGIRPVHGFILDEDLQPLKTEITSEEIKKAIANVNGVRNVDSIEVGNNLVNKILLDNKYAKLLFDKTTPFQPSENIPVSFTKSGSSVPFNLGAALQLIDNLSAKRANNIPIQYPIHTLSPQSIQQIDYFSIQPDFPPNYGIGKEGVPTPATPLRQAQAKQLQAYLLLFEQVMADYVAQLIHIRDLFSIEKTDDIAPSYFTQQPKDIVGIQNILQEEGQSIKELIKKYDPHLQRKHQFINHILARFGEDKLSDIITQYTKNNNYQLFDGNDKTDDNIEKNTIIQETAYLSQYIDTDKTLGLGSQNKSLGAQLEICDNNVKLTAPPSFVQKIYNLLDIKKIDSYTSKINSITISDEKYKKYKEDVLVFGNNPNNYKIEKDETKQTSFNLNYYSPRLKGDDINPLKIQLKSDSSQDTLVAKLKEIVEAIQSIADKSKYFYAVENMLLAYKENIKVEIHELSPTKNYLIFEENGVRFISKERISITERETIIKELTNNGLSKFIKKSSPYSKENALEFYSDYNSSKESLTTTLNNLMASQNITQIQSEVSLTTPPNENGFYSLENENYQPAVIIFKASKEIQSISYNGIEFQPFPILSYYCIIYIKSQSKQFYLASREAMDRLKNELCLNTSLSTQTWEPHYYDFSHEIKDEANNMLDNSLNRNIEVPGSTLITWEWIKKDYSTDTASITLLPLRLSIIFPNWCAYFRGTENKQLLQKLILANLPMHIAVDFYYVSPSEMASFEYDYQQWKDNVENDQLKANVLWHIQQFYEKTYGKSLADDQAQA